jgi:hypothetical protein
MHSLTAQQIGAQREVETLIRSCLGWWFCFVNCHYEKKSLVIKFVCVLIYRIHYCTLKLIEQVSHN